MQQVLVFSRSSRCAREVCDSTLHEKLQTWVDVSRMTGFKRYCNANAQPCRPENRSFPTDINGVSSSRGKSDGLLPRLP
jgi:hypothetical protein